MQKMIVLAVMLLPLSTGNCFAQADSLRKGKNQLALNLAPVLTSLLGGSNWTSKLGLMYKRNGCGKSNLRLGFYYIARPGHYPPQPYYRNYINDSTRRDYYNYTEAGEKFQLNMGYEYVFGRRKLRHFIGADLIGGIGYSQYHHYADDVVIHSAGGPPSFTNGDYETVVAHTDLGSSYSRAVFCGLSPFYGITYPLSRRWSLSAQTGFDVAFGFESRHHYVSSGGGGTQVTYFEYNVPAIINDLSLVYRF